MPTYDFECSAGHRVERIYTISGCPRVIRCPCGRRAKKAIVVPLPPTGCLENAFDPHHNTSLGTYVESRKHLRHLQKVHNCENADPNHWKQTIPRDWK